MQSLQFSKLLIPFFTGFDLEMIQELESFEFFMEYESDLKINIDSKICKELIYRGVIKIDDYKNITRMRDILKEIR